MAVCLCTDCTVAGASRIARALARELGVQMGEMAAASGVALVQVPAHFPGEAVPLVTLDGKPHHVASSGAAAWARSLAGGKA